MKNEHIVWAYGEREDGKGQAVIVGLTEQGLKYLQEEQGGAEGSLTRERRAGQ
jgi:hypothetical protein